MKNQVLVIGGGAAGCLAAGAAAENGAQVTLIEKNERIARKVLITGKGRCNVTNDCPDIRTLISNVPTNGSFLYGAFSRFMPSDTMSFFERLGVPLKVERGNRVFPVSDHAVDIVDALDSYLRKNHVSRMHDTVLHIMEKDGAVTGVETVSHGTVAAQSVILAAGGLSYPRTGSTGDGFRMARELGHTVTKPEPSLVPMTSDDPCCKEMQGLSLKNIAVRVRSRKSGKIMFDDFGELLFTHFGLSGPVILSASSHIRSMTPGEFEVLIDWKPALSVEQLDKRIQRDFAKNANREFCNSLHGLLPAKAIPVFVEKSGISPDKRVNQITKDERQSLLSLLKDFPIVLSGFRPVEEAIVTSGGVSVKEIQPNTMESKLISGLYFAGEVIDVDAYTGGFNLQIAFATGSLAGTSAALS